MCKTPKKNGFPSCFSKINLPESPVLSPQKNLTGTHRVVKDLVADVYNNIQRWNSQHLVGSELVKQITYNKSRSLQKYNPELEELINKLYEVVEILSKYKDAFQLYSQRMKSLTKLQAEEPLFISTTAERMAVVLDELATAYCKEFDMKKSVLEEIAHENNKCNWMFSACCWTFQCHILGSIERKMEDLLLETGHKRIT